MKQILKVTSPMPPSVNHYKAVRTVIKNGKPMATVYETKEAKDYKRDFKKIIIREVKKQNWIWEVNDTQHFYVDAVFYFDRIDKDADNYAKCLIDTITETQLIWKDDNTTLFRPQRIFYDKDNPRIELIIYPVDYIGIFDDQDQLNEFENKCKSCIRYRNNCSLLRKAKEGRIQKEICTVQNGEYEWKACSKYKEVKTVN